VVAQHDHFVRYCAIDDPNHIVEWCGDVILLVDEVQGQVVWRRTDVVLDSLVVQSTSLPGTIERRGLRAVAVEGLKER